MVVWVPFIGKPSKSAKESWQKEVTEHKVWENQVSYNLMTEVIEVYEKKGDAASLKIAQDLKEVRKRFKPL